MGFFGVQFISSSADAAVFYSATPVVNENECTLQETRDLVQVTEAFQHSLDLFAQFSKLPIKSPRAGKELCDLVLFCCCCCHCRDYVLQKTVRKPQLCSLSSTRITSW